jgi:hypothetical protein
MRKEIIDHIGVYENVYPEGYCQHLINEFDRLSAAGAGNNRQVGPDAVKKHHKDDYQISFNYNGQAISGFENSSPIEMFFHGLQQCFDDYSEYYSVIHDTRLHASIMKMQRTDPGGGYHVWHAERAGQDRADRAVVYSLYLNTLDPESGGETEFLYQQKRFRPKENTLMLWPAGYTHAHRGNTVLGEKSKYIVTGWFYYV